MAIGLLRAARCQRKALVRPLILAMSLVAVVGIAFSVSAQPPTPGHNVHAIGVVDVQRILSESAAGLSARQRLEAEKAAMERDLTIRWREREALREELDVGPLRRDPQRWNERLREFKEARASAERLVEHLDSLLRQEEARLIKDILDEISLVIAEVGSQQRYFAIVDQRALDGLKRGDPSAAILYSGIGAPSRLSRPPTSVRDVTTEIIERYDAKSVGSSR